MFSLTHLIIRRNLQEKTNFVSLPQSANSFWKSIKWPACLGRKQLAQTSNFPAKLWRRDAGRWKPRCQCRRHRAFPRPGWLELKEHHALTAAAKIKPFFNVFLMWITGGFTTGICIQTGNLQISSNPGDKGMTFMICDCYPTRVNCQNKAFKNGNFFVCDWCIL